MSGPIYTRHGDGGETSLVGGGRVSKHSARVEAYGTIDEANAAIGLARAALQAAAPNEARLDTMLDFTQHRLFNCSSRLATPHTAETPHTATVTSADVTRLESYIDELSATTGILEHFVLPGGSELASRLHVARTVARRAERRIVELDTHDAVDPFVLAFVNRLSDMLFAAARYANGIRPGGDVLWDPKR